ncbi:MAG: cellulase family glycosylhydrolase, partial [Kiritimatiellae bacterium]|nr:cellulase family glycosylhydrolase [Kiritimatiellia bacterium]
FKNRENIWAYGLMNEPTGISTTNWLAAVQAAVDGVREEDMGHYVLLPGTYYSNAHRWPDHGEYLINVVDPADKRIFEAHSYWDGGHDGSYNQSFASSGLSVNYGVNDITAFVNWCNANNVQGFIGEFGVPWQHPDWAPVLVNALEYMQANGVSGTIWAGGPWWNADYELDVEIDPRTNAPRYPVDILQNYTNGHTQPYAPDFRIYGESIVSGLLYSYPYSFGGAGATINVDPESTDQAQSGSKSFKVTYTLPSGSYANCGMHVEGGFYLTENITTAGQVLSLYVRGDSGANFRLRLQDITGTSGPQVTITNYGPAIGNSWQRYEIPLTDLVNTSMDGSDYIERIRLDVLNQDNTQRSFYIDNMKVEGPEYVPETSVLPIARYDFENPSDPGEDSSGSATTHDGTVNGSPSLDTNEFKIGASSIRMYGNQNQYIEVPDHSELDSTDQLTIAFWAKPTTTGIDANARGIVSKRIGFNNNVSYSMFLSASGAELVFYLDKGTSQPSTITTGYLFQTTWQHVAMVFDGTEASSNRVKLYVNGSLHGTYSHSASQIRDLNSSLILGSLNPNYSTSYDGWLDDIHIHRTALGESEIAALFEEGNGPGNGPIAFYDFENGSDLGLDTSNNGEIHNGSVNGTPIQDSSDAMFGGSSIRMYGDQNQYIQIADDPELDGTDELTIAFWAKPTTTGIDSNARGIVSKRVGFNNNVSYSMFLANSGAGLSLYLDNGGSQPSTISTGYLFQTTWQHVAMVFDGTEAASNRVKLYVNGSLFGTYSHSASQIRDLNSPLTIGSLNANYSASYDGWLDDVRIYRRALSAPDITVLHGLSPVAFWDFDDASGSTAMDLSENALDISLQGSYSWTSGQVGGALDLSGQSNTYGTVIDPDELEGTDKLSIAFWVRPENLTGSARFILSKRDSMDVNCAFSVYFWSGNRLFIDLDKNNNGNRHSTITQFQNDTWYHVAVVYDGTLPQNERGRVYINGDLDANSPFGVSSSSIPNYPSDFYLGIANSGYPTTFGGRIDDLLIFREALQESEVEEVGGF